MRWLVTGALGMLGTEVRGALESRAIDHTAVDRGGLDLLDADEVDRAVAGHDVVVNCAAWTAVDEAEAHEPEAHAVNAVAPGLLARAASRHGARIVHVSTDYVFAGDAGTPYAEDAPLDPRSAYGRTKAAGERAVRAEAPDSHLLVRTAWMYGAAGTCFPRTIARAARRNGRVSVVDDQVGQPTWARDVAEMIVRLVDREAPTGTWHATSGGETSWFGFAREVVAAVGLSPDVVSPTGSESLDRPAPRPAYSVLGHDRLRRHGIAPIRSWQERWAEAASEVLGVEELQ